jgi:hypothetical protein
MAENVKPANSSRFASGTRPKPTKSTTRARISIGRQTVPTGTSHSSWPDFVGRVLVEAHARAQLAHDHGLVRVQLEIDVRPGQGRCGGLDDGLDVHDLLRLGLEGVARVAHVIGARR